MISVILQSYLGDYPNAAANRDEKLARAIRSVIEQTYKNWELLIIADGCEKTVQIAAPFVNDQIRLFSIEKQRMWSGSPRNAGIRKARGNWICYLDADDVFGNNHLKIIAGQLGEHRWYIFNDYIYDSQFKQRQVMLQHGRCGTSNIVHRSDCGLIWEAAGTYASDDWLAIRNLMKYKHAEIRTPEYYVCHLPFRGGYDI